MNIQKRKKIIRLIFFVICASYISVSCQTGKKVKLIQAIAKGIEVENEKYYFSEEADIKIAETNYSLRSKAEYDVDGYVMKLLIYQPEGVLEYTKEDLVNDKNLLKNYGYSFKNEYTFSDEKLNNANGKKILTKQLEEGILSTKKSNKVTLYYLK